MSVKRVEVVKNSYYDSVTLMLVSREISEMKGIKEVVVAMATDHNKESLSVVGLYDSKLDGATANDLVIAMEAEDDSILQEAYQKVDELLKKKKETGGDEEYSPVSLEGAFEYMPDANLVMISVAGEYAAYEARKALMAGKHVFMFSDNVPIEDEIELKTLANEKGLLMMGPDCGTAIINGAPLAFANEVPRGDIGIVAASGTGLQEVSTIIAKNGKGISQAIGTGGRDLKKEVGGKMVIAGIKALQEDPATKVIVVISKPPAPEVAKKVLDVLKEGSKPVVVDFINGDPEMVKEYGFYAPTTLEETALVAVALSDGREPDIKIPGEEQIKRVAVKERERLADGQKYIRGLYTGGTLCDEAMYLIEKELGEPTYSNAPLHKGYELKDIYKSEKHTVIDLGEDEFTQGQPHPMIDPRTRQKRILEEAKDPEVAVILLDIVIGYGSNEDMAGALAPYIKEAKELAEKDGRYLSVVASICGTKDDPQNLDEQQKKLEEVGVVVMPSNVQAVRTAIEIVKGK